jgi:hypothetical protein
MLMSCSLAYERAHIILHRCMTNAMKANRPGEEKF